MRTAALPALAAGAALVLASGIAGAVAPGQAPSQPPEVPDPKLGKAASIDIESDWVWVEAGARLLRQPEPASGYFVSVEVRTQLPVLERRDEWLLVRYGSSRGWISATGEHSGAKPASIGPPASLRRITRASEVFRLERQAEPLGPFALYTDVADDSILKALDRTSSHLASAYRQRFGLAGEPRSRETVLLFANEEDYRAFAQEDSAVISPDLRGHATPEI
ncbi:MAG: hypothetical protein OES47_13545, partial [Acidobacteriota bacterium]|nr:hypothetical protein [Acidobacteriota bacterium]